MDLKATCFPYRLLFKEPAGTSRGVLHSKETWFLVLSHAGHTSVGECAVFRGLSCDDRPDYGERLEELCRRISHGETPHPEQWANYPSIRFGLEMALGRLEAELRGETYLASPFTDGQDSIPINGLVWMGDFEQMALRLEDKLRQGFRCIKIKIGAIDFERELELLSRIRARYTPPGGRDPRGCQRCLLAPECARTPATPGSLRTSLHRTAHRRRRPRRNGPPVRTVSLAHRAGRRTHRSERPAGKTPFAQNDTSPLPRAEAFAGGRPRSFPSMDRSSRGSRCRVLDHLRAGIQRRLGRYCTFFVSFHKTGCGSAESFAKTSFSICLYTRLSVSLPKSPPPRTGDRRTFYQQHPLSLRRIGGTFSHYGTRAQRK